MTDLQIHTEIYTPKSENKVLDYLTDQINDQIRKIAETNVLHSVADA